MDSVEQAIIVLTPAAKEAAAKAGRRELCERSSRERSIRALAQKRSLGITAEETLQQLCSAEALYTVSASAASP